MREPGTQVVGWGLGSYGLRGVERERREVQVVDEEDQARISLDEIESPESPPRDQSFRRRGYQPEPQPPQQAPPDPEPELGWTSLWWWGPLRRWRLQDSTVYR